MKTLIKSLNILPRWIIVFIDLAIMLLSISIAFALRFDFNYELIKLEKPLQSTLLYVGCSIVSILITKSYAGIIRYTTLQDAVRITYMVSLTTLNALVINYIYYVMGALITPRGVLLIAMVIAIVLLVSYRLLVHQVFSYYDKTSKGRNHVIVYGAGRLGQMTIKLIDEDLTTNSKVIIIIDNDPRMIGKRIAGIDVISENKDLDRLIEEYSIKELIIAKDNLDLETKNALVDKFLEYKLKIRTVPSPSQMINGEFSSTKQIQSVKIEELLGREPVKIDSINVREQVVNKVVLITGAAGSIGSEIVRQVCAYQPSRVILLDQGETPLYEINHEINAIKEKLKDTDIIPIIADIRDKERLETIFNFYKPNIVYHAAAYKHVPMMERNAREAVRTNVFGSKNLADLAVEFKVEKFVMISTDKAVNPTNVMGASKRIAEIYVQALSEHIKRNGIADTRFITTRFGNVLGSNGSVIPLFKKQIEKNGPVTVTHKEMTRYFMTIPEACQLSLEAGAMGKGNEIFIVEMGKPVKIIDLAEKMIELSGFVPYEEIPIKFSGLRPGEKLMEELLANEENTLPTHHEKIKIAQIREQNYEEICAKFEKLRILTKGDQDLDMVAQMKRIVPEFISNSSIYEMLDEKKETS